MTNSWRILPYCDVFESGEPTVAFGLYDVFYFHSVAFGVVARTRTCARPGVPSRLLPSGYFEFRIRWRNSRRKGNIRTGSWLNFR